LAGRVKASVMSFAGFSTDDASGRMRGYVGGGAFTDDPLETFGGIGVMAIPDLQRPLRHICENGFERHVAANLSKSAAALSSMRFAARPRPARGGRAGVREGRGSFARVGAPAFRAELPWLSA
jgi:hypothetical protein